MGRRWICLGALALLACGRTELWLQPLGTDAAGGGDVGGGSGSASGGSAGSDVGGNMNPFGVCGDGTLDPGEACDDGNAIDADGCEADCTLPACGNGIVDPGELCLSSPAEVTQGPALIYFGPRAIDCDGDGDLDLAQVVGTALFEPTVISVLINDGQGEFGDTVVESVLSPGHQFYGSFGLARFDGSPETGIAFVGQTQSSPHTLTLLSGQGDCRFSPYQRVALTEPHTFPLAVAADGDDLDDLVLLRPDSQRLAVVTSGTGFTVSPLVPSQQRLAPAVVADLNGDGRSELISADPAGGTVSLRRGLADTPWFGLPLDLPAGPRPFATAAADLNGDGRLDLAVLHEGGELRRMLGDGSGGLGAAVTSSSGLPPGARAIDLALGDIDADGDLDALASADVQGGTALALRLNVGGTFVAPEPLALPVSTLAGETTPTTLQMHDLNNDGALDVVVSTYLPQGDFTGLARVYVFLANP